MIQKQENITLYHFSGIIMKCQLLLVNGWYRIYVKDLTYGHYKNWNITVGRRWKTKNDVLVFLKKYGFDS